MDLMQNLVDFPSWENFYRELTRNGGYKVISIECSKYVMTNGTIKLFFNRTILNNQKLLL